MVFTPSRIKSSACKKHMLLVGRSFTELQVKPLSILLTIFSSSCSISAQTALWLIALSATPHCLHSWRQGLNLALSICASTHATPCFLNSGYLLAVGQTKPLDLSLHSLAQTHTLQTPASTNCSRSQGGRVYVGRRVTRVTGHFNEYHSSKQS